MTYTRQQFISKVATDIVKYATHIRPSVAIAQACLESANGNSELALKAHNLFGIKASSPWTGPAYNKVSGEHKNGKKVYEASDFRKYTSWTESIKDHAGFFTSTEFRTSDAAYGLALKAKDYKTQARMLGPKFNGDKSSYATDPDYGQKLIDIIGSYDLTKYDKEFLNKNKQNGEDVEMTKRTASQIAKQVWGTQTIEKSLWNGYAGRISGNPRGVVIHNDAGRANGRNYESWLRSARVGRGKAEQGFAHYYTCRQFNARYEHTYNKAYHGGHSYPNNYLIGFEVCESLSATDANFLKNEEVNLLQAAEDLLYYKLPVNHDTVKLHRDYSSTTCPHRSWDLHVGRNAPNTAANRQKMRQYFIDRIKYWTDVLNGVKPIPGSVTSPTVPNTTPSSGSNSSGYVLTPQTRRVGNWVANQRTAPSTSGDIVYELEANFHFEVKGYVHGQSIDGNDIWFVGKNSGQYVHSGGTTNPSTNNLTYLESDPHNKVKKSFDTFNTFTADIDLVIYDGPAEGTKRVGKAKKGTTIQFNKVFLSNRAWIGYKNGRGEDWYLPIADYNSKTNEIGKLNGTLKYDLIRK